jgi:hypothetical protein
MRKYPLKSYLKYYDTAMPEHLKPTLRQAQGDIQQVGVGVF